VLKQDLLIGIVSVSAIVYVILFDSSPGGILPSSPPPGALSGSSSSLARENRTTDSVLAEERRDADGDATVPPTPPATRLLVIGSEGSLTPQTRTKLIEDVRVWIDRAVPGEFDRLKADFESMSQVADSVALYRVALDESLARAFQAKMAELKRYYLLQRTTVQLSEVAGHYLIPGSSERERIERELERLRELSRDVDWVEQRYDFVYPKDRKDYLKQLIEVLEGMARI
jgi:hypothetical protein